MLLDDRDIQVRNQDESIQATAGCMAEPELQEQADATKEPEQAVAQQSKPGPEVAVPQSTQAQESQVPEKAKAQTIQKKSSPMLTHAEILSRAAAQVVAWGLELHPNHELAIDNDAHPARAREAGSRRTDWPVSIYVGSDSTGINPDDFRPCIRYNDFRGKTAYVPLCSNDEWKTIPVIERKKYIIESQQFKKNQDDEQAKIYENKACKAQKIIASASWASSMHPYLSRKNVGACEGLKYGSVWRAGEDGSLGSYEPALLVPLRDVAGKIWTFQAIYSDGVKRHFAGGRVRGSFFEIRRRGDDGPTAYCEGLATGLSIHEATGWRVIVCVDCGNLLPVMRALAEVGKLGDARIVADNDHATKHKDGSPWNPGVEHAVSAATALQVPYCVPMPSGIFDIASHDPLTDANDFASIFGRDSLADALKNLIMPPPPAIPADPGSDSVVATTISPEAAADLAVFDAPAVEPAGREPVPASPHAEEAGAVVAGCDDDDDGEAPSLLPPPPEPPRGIFPPEVEDALADVADKRCSGLYALPLGNLLGAVAAAVGGRRKAAAFRSSPQPCSLMVANIGDPGTGKTDAGAIFQEVLTEWNRRAYDEYETEVKDTKKAKASYRYRMRKGLVGEDETEPEDPPRPALVRMGDTTLEALGSNLKSFQDRGMIPSTSIFVDELRGGLASLSCYVQGGGNAGRGLSQLLSLYDGGAWDNSRIDSSRCFTLPHAWLTICGNLQPKLVPDVFNEAMMNQGGFGRFLFTIVESPAEFNPNLEELNPETKSTLQNMMNNLLNLQDSKIIKFSKDATELFLSWSKEKWKKAYIEGCTDLFSKRSRQNTRLALVIYLVENALLPPEEANEFITIDIMKKAIKLSEYFEMTQKQVLMIAKLGKNVASVDSVHRKVAGILLKHIHEIHAMDDAVAVKTIIEWLNKGGLKVKSGDIVHLLTPLGIKAQKRRHVRVRIFNEETLAVLKTIAGAQCVQRRFIAGSSAEEGDAHGNNVAESAGYPEDAGTVPCGCDGERGGARTGSGKLEDAGTVPGSSHEAGVDAAARAGCPPDGGDLPGGGEERRAGPALRAREPEDPGNLPGGRKERADVA